MNATLILSIIVILTGLTSACHALLTKRDSKSAFGWIAFCLFLPLVGPSIYLIFGINRVQQRALKNYFAKLDIDDSPSIFEPQGSIFRPLSLVGEKVTGKGLRSCDSVKLLENGESLYPAMLKAIDEATSKIFLSTYIFDNDETGEKFINALHNAKSRGVEVRVFIDALGEYMSFPRIGRKLKLRDLQFLRFNPITLIPPAIHINLRNHRKILIVDSKIAFTGGQNIGNRHLADDLENQHRVIDLHFRFTGKVVDELERAFLRDWHTAHGKEDEIPFEPSNQNKSESKIWTRLVLDGPNEYIDRLNDLLVGIILGLVVAVMYILYNNYKPLCGDNIRDPLQYPGHIFNWKYKAGKDNCR